MEIKDRIRLIRETRGLTMSQLSSLLNVPRDTISNYELGKRKVSIDYINKLHLELNANFDWLITGDGEMFVRSDLNNVSKSENYYFIPLLSNLVSAGPGCTADKKIIDKFIPISLNYINEILNTKPEGLYFMTVNGDSMAPTLLNEDIILIDSTITTLSDNKIYVIQLEDELLVKRAFRKDETTYAFNSDNTREYQPILVSTSINFKLIGQVIWQSRKIV